MAAIKDIIKVLGDEARIEFGRYRDLELELVPFQGREIVAEDIPELKRIIEGMQDAYQELHPLYDYISSQYQHATNMMTNHTNFIKALRELGAQPERNAPKTQIYMGEA